MDKSCYFSSVPLFDYLFIYLFLLLGLTSILSAGKGQDILAEPRHVMLLPMGGSRCGRPHVRANVFALTPAVDRKCPKVFGRQSSSRRGKKRARDPVA